MVKRRRKRKINSRPSNNRKIKKNYTGLYIWIAFLIIGAVLYNFFYLGFLIFGGIILLGIIRKGWEGNRYYSHRILIIKFS